MTKKLIISNTLNYIYFEVPKAASRTIYTLLKGTECIHIQWQQYEKKWDSYFKFTFVRNPVDRLISAYNYFYSHLGKGNIYYLHQYGLNENMSFDAFIKAIEPNNKHWCPQVDLIPDNINFVGKVENFAIDWLKVCLELGISKKISHKNQSNPIVKKESLNRETIDIIYSKFDKDFKTFGYE